MVCTHTYIRTLRRLSLCNRKWYKYVINDHEARLNVKLDIFGKVYWSWGESESFLFYFTIFVGILYVCLCFKTRWNRFYWTRFFWQTDIYHLPLFEVLDLFKNVRKYFTQTLTNTAQIKKRFTEIYIKTNAISAWKFI